MLTARFFVSRHLEPSLPIHIGKHRRICYALHKLQAWRMLTHQPLQKLHRQLRRSEAQQRMAAGRQQGGQAAQQAGVVLGGDEAALLVAGRVGDDQVVRAAADELGP